MSFWKNWSKRGSNSTGKSAILPQFGVNRPSSTPIEPECLAPPSVEETRRATSPVAFQITFRGSVAGELRRLAKQMGDLSEKDALERVLEQAQQMEDLKAIGCTFSVNYPDGMTKRFPPN